MEPETERSSVATARFIVVVPFASNVELLRVALLSVAAQSDQQWEAVVIDDSPDSAGLAGAVEQLVADLADERFSVRRNESPLGVAGAFNRCFDVAVECSAEIATILHADDQLEPEYVEVMRAAHLRHPGAACVAPRVTVIDGDGQVVRTLPDTVKRWLWPKRTDELSGEPGLRALLRGQFFYCPSVSYRMELMDLPAWNSRWMQVMDLELYATVLLRGGTIALEPAAVYRYRRHAASMTSVNSMTMVRSVEEAELSNELVAAAQRIGWRSAARTGRLRLTVRLQALVRAAALFRCARWSDARRAVNIALR